MARLLIEKKKTKDNFERNARGSQPEFLLFSFVHQSTVNLENVLLIFLNIITIYFITVFFFVSS